MNGKLLAAFAVAVLAATAFAVVAEFEESDADDSTIVATIGSTGKYTSLASAFSAAQDGDTIVVQKDMTEVSMIYLSDGRTLTLDLNGHEIYFAYQNMIYVSHGTLTITGEGMLSEKEGNYYFAPIFIESDADSDTYNYCVVEIGADVTLMGWTAIFIDFVDDNEWSYGIVVDVYGTCIGDADNTGYLGHGIYLQGLIKGTTGSYPVINIHEGAYVNGNGGEGIYAAGFAEWNITGATIIGATGIEIRAGILNVTDSTITGTATPTSVTPNGNGGTTLGAGIAVAQHTSKLPITVTVYSGVISGFSAFYESNPQNNDAEFLAQITIRILGGTYNTTNGGTVAVYSEDFEDFIGGGTFSTTPEDKYLADGVVISDDGTVAIPSADITVKSGNVTLSTACTAEYTIYYTIDGTTPSSTNGTVYSGTFSVSSGTTVRAIVYIGEFYSEVTSASYSAPIILPDDRTPVTPVVDDSTDNDNSTTVVACAAAAVAAALMAAFILLEYRKK